MAREKYLVFARKWRPQTFEDVVGQEHITRTLQNSIEAGRIGHAFLFIGSRGIGKTTTARILAKALNCNASENPTANPCGVCDNCTSIAEGNSMDVIEIDGASNNSVDNVREIRENVRMVPSRSRFKIYIIDEVHQLSSGAFNALLKTLEEPPAHAIFILATTESHKVPATIISRCQRFDFRRVPVGRIVELLRGILDAENIKASDEALHAVARAAEGGIRDAESILDQLVSYCDKEITFQDVFDVLGLVDWKVLHDLCDAMIAKDVSAQLKLIAAVVDAGKDLSQFVQEVLRYFRNLLICKTGGAKELLSLPEDEIARMQAHADRFTLTNLIRMVEQFAELTKGFDSQFAQRIALEALLIQISKRAVELNVDAVIEKLAMLAERGFSSPEGNPPPFPGNGGAAERREADPPAGDGSGDDAPYFESYNEPAFTEEDPPPSRVQLTDANLADVWPQILETATASQISLQIGLSQAQPQQVAGSRLVLRFDRSVAEAAKMVEKAENRRTLEEALAAFTINVTSFDVVVGDSAAAAPDMAEAPDPGEPRQTRASAGSRAAQEDVRRAMADDHIARVLQVFKGHIVEVKHPRHD